RDNLAWTRAWLEPLQSVEVMDEYTLEWDFKKPWGAFLGTMASVPGYAVSPKALQRDAARTKAKKLERELVTLRRRAGQEKDQQKAADARKVISEKEEQLKRYADLSRDARNRDTYPVGTGPYMFESAST